MNVEKIGSRIKKKKAKTRTGRCLKKDAKRKKRIQDDNHSCNANLSFEKHHPRLSTRNIIYVNEVLVVGRDFLIHFCTFVNILFHFSSSSSGSQRPQSIVTQTRKSLHLLRNALRFYKTKLF